jgi:serine/threonine protein kinase
MFAARAGMRHDGGVADLADPSAPLPEGLGRFRVHRRLATTHTGVTFDATSDAGERVVLKLARPGSEEIAARVVRELEILKRIKHPGVVRLVDSGMIDAHLFIAVERIKGSTLRSLLDGGFIDLEAAIAVGLQVGTTLAHLHEIGVIQRDLTPESIIIDLNGKPILADFGLATTRGGTRITAPGATLGSEAFVAPELLDRGRPSPKSDQYALGRLLLDLTMPPLPMDHSTDRSPMLDRSAAREIEWSRYPSARGFRELQHILMRSLSFDPDERFEDLHDFVAALARAAAIYALGDSPAAPSILEDEIPIVPGAVDTDDLAPSTADALPLVLEVKWAEGALADQDDLLAGSPDDIVIEEPVVPSSVSVSPLLENLRKMTYDFRRPSRSGRINTEKVSERAQRSRVRARSFWAKTLGSSPWDHDSTDSSGLFNDKTLPEEGVPPGVIRHWAEGLSSTAAPKVEIVRPPTVLSRPTSPPTDPPPAASPPPLQRITVSSEPAAPFESDSRVLALRSVELRPLEVGPPVQEPRAVQTRVSAPDLGSRVGKAAPPLDLSPSSPEPSASPTGATVRAVTPLHALMLVSVSLLVGTLVTLAVHRIFGLRSIASLIADERSDEAVLALSVSDLARSAEAPAPLYRYRGSQPTRADLERARESLVRAVREVKERKIRDAKLDLGACIETADLPECHEELGLILALSGHPAALFHLERYVQLAPEGEDAPAVKTMLQARGFGAGSEHGERGSGQHPEP